MTVYLETTRARYFYVLAVIWRCFVLSPVHNVCSRVLNQSETFNLVITARLPDISEVPNPKHWQK